MTGLVAGVLILGTACQAPSSHQLPVMLLPKATVAIESLKQPQQLERSATLKGDVVQRVPVLNGWLYQVDDGTGQVWVSTQQTAPTLGTQIYVEGILRYRPVEVGDVDLGDYYLEEQQVQP